MAEGRTPSNTVLKILSGVQSGVEVSLAEGEYVLGSGDDDIQLIDVSLKPGHARLRVGRGKIEIAGGAGSLRTANGLASEANGTFQEIEPLDVVTAGTTRFALGLPTANWASIAEENGAEPAPSKRRRAAPRATAADAFRWRRVRQIAASLLLVVAIATIAVWLFPTRGGRQEVAVVEQRSDLDVVREALQPFPFAESLDVHQEVDGAIYVNGYVATPVERRAIVAAVRDSGVPARVRLWVTEAIRSELESLVAAEELDVGVELSDAGAVTLSGLILDTARAAEFVSLVTDRVLGLSSVTSEIDTTDTLLADINELAQLSSIEPWVLFRAVDGVIEANGVLPVEKIDAWVGFLQSYSNKFAESIPLRSIVQLQTVEGEAAGAAPALGAADRAIVIGDMEGPGGEIPLDVDRLTEGTFELADVFVGAAGTGPAAVATAPPTSPDGTPTTDPEGSVAQPAAPASPLLPGQPAGDAPAAAVLIPQPADPGIVDDLVAAAATAEPLPLPLLGAAGSGPAEAGSGPAEAGSGPALPALPVAFTGDAPPVLGAGSGDAAPTAESALPGTAELAVAPASEPLPDAAGQQPAGTAPLAAAAGQQPAGTATPAADPLAMAPTDLTVLAPGANEEPAVEPLPTAATPAAGTPPSSPAVPAAGTPPSSPAPPAAGTPPSPPAAGTPPSSPSAPAAGVPSSVPVASVPGAPIAAPAEASPARAEPLLESPRSPAALDSPRDPAAPAEATAVVDAEPSRFVADNGPSDDGGTADIMSGEVPDTTASAPQTTADELNLLARELLGDLEQGSTEAGAALRAAAEDVIGAEADAEAGISVGALTSAQIMVAERYLPVFQRTQAPDGGAACWPGSQLTPANLPGVLLWLDLLSVSDAMSIADYDAETQTLLLEAALNPTSTAFCASGGPPSVYLTEVQRNPDFIYFIARDLPPFALDIAGASVASDRFIQTRTGEKMHEGSAPDGASRIVIVGELGVAVQLAQGMSAVIFGSDMNWLIQ